MTQIVRWVHPKKVNKHGTLKPSAFPLGQVATAMSRLLTGKCDSGTISLASFALLRAENKNKAKENACEYCSRGTNQSSSWNDSEECDCENAKIGARGACTTEVMLSTINFELQNAVSEFNPLHVLLCTSAASVGEDSKDPAAVQKQLMDSFSNIQTVKRLFQNC